MINYIKNIISGEKWTSKGYAKFFFMLAFIFYLTSVSNEFSLDDHLVTNQHVFVQKGFSGIYDILTSPYQNDELNVGEFRPITQITYAIEYELFEINPKFSHLINILLYAFLCLICFKFLIQLTGKNTSLFPVIFISLIIFTIHPIHTEVVSSLKNRESILSMLFGMLTLISFLKFIELKKWIYILSMFLLFGLAILSKVDSVVFVPLIIGVAIYKKVSWKYIAPFSVAILSLFFIRNTYANYITPNSQRANFIYETPLFGDVSLFEKIGFSIQTFYEYLSLLILPYPLRFYYGYNMVEIPSVSSISMWVSLLVLIGLLYLFIRNLRHNPFLSFSIFWFIISISIFLQVVESVTGIIGERHAFISSLGFSLILGFAIRYSYSKTSLLQNIKFKSAVVLFSALVVLTFGYNQNRIAEWKTNDSIFEADIPKLTNSAYANFEYGNHLNRLADKCTDSLCFNLNLQKSIASYSQAIKVYPDFTFSYYNIGMVHIRLGQNDLANSFFEKARSLDSNFRSSNYFLGLYKMDRGDTLNAIKYYKQELKNRPENVRAIERLYDLCVAQGKNEEVLKVFEEIKNKKAKNARVYFALSKLYEMKGDSLASQQMYQYSISENVQNEVNFQW